MNFTKSKYECSKGEKIAFECIFCANKNHCVLGATSNIKTHLATHKDDERDLSNWLTAFDASSNTPHNKYFIDNETIKMVRYFIARNSSVGF